MAGNGTNGTTALSHRQLKALPYLCLCTLTRVPARPGRAANVASVDEGWRLPGGGGTAHRHHPPLQRGSGSVVGLLFLT